MAQNKAVIFHCKNLKPKLESRWRPLRTVRDNKPPRRKHFCAKNKKTHKVAQDHPWGQPSQMKTFLRNEDRGGTPPIWKHFCETETEAATTDGPAGQMNSVTAVLKNISTQEIWKPKRKADDVAQDRQWWQPSQMKTFLRNGDRVGNDRRTGRTDELRDGCP